MRLAGRPLTELLPYGLRIEPLEDDFTIIEPAETTFAGRLLVPFVAAAGLEIADVDIPSSGAFNEEDLRELWRSGQELASWQARRALATSDGGFAEPERMGNPAVLGDWRALNECSGQAERLLRGWPSRIGRELRWVPVGIGGGYEDLDRTEREVALRGYYGRTQAGVAVTRSARWFGKAEGVKLSAVAALAERVAVMAEGAVRREDETVLREVLRPIRNVGMLALDSSGRADPEPSSWPTTFLQFARSCMQVLSELHARDRGVHALPLLDTDELYEGWLAVSIREIMSGWLQETAEPSDGSLGSWVDDAITYELRAKPAVRRRTRIGAHEYRALVANELVPDVVVSATRGEITEVAILDAKAWVRMQPESILSESAKYLYGIRRLGDEALPAVVSVDLVSCAPEPSLHAAADARIGFVHATPTSGMSELGAVVGRVVSSLAAALERREQEASLR